MNGQSNTTQEVAVPQKRCIASWIFPIVCQLYIGTAQVLQHRTLETNVHDVAVTNNITQSQPSIQNNGNGLNQVHPGKQACGSNGCSDNGVASASTSKSAPNQAVREIGTRGSNKCGNKVPASQYGCPRGYSSDMNGCCDST